MRLEHHLVGGYVRYISPHIIIIICFLPKDGDVEVVAGCYEWYSNAIYIQNKRHEDVVQVTSVGW